MFLTTDRAGTAVGLTKEKRIDKFYWKVQNVYSQPVQIMSSMGTAQWEGEVKMHQQIQQIFCFMRTYERSVRILEYYNI